MAKPVRFDLDPELRDACIASIRAGSKSFHAASILLPGRVRLAARALYAFCRASDDLIDEETGAHADAASLMLRIGNLYDGAPMDSVPDLAFARVVADFDIPRAVPEALVEGFRWDEEGRSYETLEDVIAYAVRVASTVGLMMTVIMGVRRAHVLARAADLGIAMQLTNIARDVGEDARRGRIYLPTEWLDNAGIDRRRFLENPVHDTRMAGVVAQLLAAAETFYERGLTGVGGLPFDCRPAIRSAGAIYRDIGREIAAHGHDAVGRRAHTSKARKIELILHATANPFQLGPVRNIAPHRHAAALVAACATREAETPVSVDDKAGRMLEILEMARARTRAAAFQGGGPQ